MHALPVWDVVQLTFNISQRDFPPSSLPFPKHETKRKEGGERGREPGGWGKERRKNNTRVLG